MGVQIKKIFGEPIIQFIPPVLRDDSQFEVRSVEVEPLLESLGLLNITAPSGWLYGGYNKRVSIAAVVYC